MNVQLTQEEKDQVIGINLKSTKVTEEQLLKFVLQFQNVEVILSDINLTDEGIVQIADLNQLICYNDITMDQSIKTNSLLKTDKYNMLLIPYQYQQIEEDQIQQENVQEEKQEENEKQEEQPQNQTQQETYISTQQSIQQDYNDFNEQNDQEYTWLHVTKQIGQKYLFNHLPETIEYIKFENYLITQSEIKQNNSVSYIDILNINIESQTENICNFLKQFTNLKFLIVKQFLLPNKFIEELQDKKVKVYIAPNQQKGLQDKLSQLYQNYDDYGQIIERYLIKYDEQVEVSKVEDLQNLNNKLYCLTIQESCVNDLVLLQQSKDINISILKSKCQQNSFNYDSLVLICQLHPELRQIECNLQLNNDQIKQLKRYNILRYNNKVIGKYYFGTYQNPQDLKEKLINTITKTEQQVQKLQEQEENNNQQPDQQQQKENQNLVISSLQQDGLQSTKSDVDELIEDLENQQSQQLTNTNAQKIENTLYNNDILETKQQFQFIQPMEMQIYSEEQLQQETDAIIEQFNQDINNLLDQDQKQQIPNIQQIMKQNIEKVKNQQMYCQEMVHKCDTNLFYQSQSITTDVQEQPLAQALRKVNDHHQKFINYMNDYKQDLEQLNDEIYSITKTDLIDLEKQITVAFNTLNDLSEYGMNASTINEDIRTYYMKAASKLKNIQQEIYMQQYKKSARRYLNNIYFTKRIDQDDFVSQMNNKEEVYINEFSKNQVIQMFITAVSQFQKLQQSNTAAQVNFYHYFNNTFFATKFGQHFADLRREKYYNALKIYWDESNIIKCISNTLKYNTFAFFNLSYVNLQTVVYQLLTASIMEQNANMIEEEIFKLVDQMKVNGVDSLYAINVVNTLKQVLDEDNMNQLEIYLPHRSKIEWIELVAIAMIIKAKKEDVWKSE